MIWGSSTVDPRWMATAPTRPWDDVDPVHKVHTRDSQENIECCLNCTLQRCMSDSDACILKKKRKPSKRTHEETLEIDKKVKKMLYDVWRPIMLRKELGLTKGDYYASRKRLLKRGEISDGRK